MDGTRSSVTRPQGRVRIGDSVTRSEDARLLCGRGCYSDDFSLPGQVHAATLRSPHSHARIRNIDTFAALRSPGVLAVLTGADLIADKLRCLPHLVFAGSPPNVALVDRPGFARFLPGHTALALSKVRFVGEIVALVVAETIAAAKDAAEHIVVDYEALPSICETAAAAAAGAPLVWEEAGSNVCVDAEIGSKEATEMAFAHAAFVARIETWIPRVTAAPMEPRAAIGSYDSETQRFTLYAGSGGSVLLRDDLAGVLGVKKESVRVVAREVGGSFGTKNFIYPEFALVAWASQRVGRPVKWTCERQDAFLTDYQGRDLHVTAELALDKAGNFLAIRGCNTSNVGSFVVSMVPLQKGVQLMSGIYRIPAAHFRARAVLSNTAPTTVYRSAGRPEAIFVIERLVDIAAKNFGFDPVELRRKNMIHCSSFPLLNPLGLTYDPSAFVAVMDRALALADWDGFASRKATSRKLGRLRGIGIGNYVELTGGSPRERAEITVHPNGSIDVVIGTLSSGQGHETSFAQLVSDWLGVEFTCIHLKTGDTDIVSVGGGTQSGRSMRFAAMVIGDATDVIIARGRRVAAVLLQDTEDNVGFADGIFHVLGSDRHVSLFEIAKAMLETGNLPSELNGPLIGVGDITQRTGTFPYGTQVCEVEIDPETGVTEIVRYAAIDDVGCAINPLILHGQTHGGVAQGIGQALWERCYHDPETGQALCASFLDYAVPRADVSPEFVVEISEVPAPSNKLGIRAGGEGGTTGAPAAVANAVMSALGALGITHMDMPLTSERVWRAIQHASNQPLHPME